MVVKLKIRLYLLKNMVDVYENLICRKQVKPARSTDICQHTIVKCRMGYVQVLRRATLQYELHDGLSNLSF